MSKHVPLAAVLGHPISHSRSPKLHGHWLKRYGLPGHYVPIDVAPNDLEDALNSLKMLGFVGANVTIPHKETVLRYADHVTDRATLIGAANTLIFTQDGKLHADNTDGYGFLENLRQGAPGWRASEGPALVLGAGGAARAILVSLLDAGVPDVILTNRTRVKAESLADDFGKRVRVVDWHMIGDVLPSAATLVNTTSLGMVGQPELRLPLEGLHSGQVVTDIVYTPLETGLLRAAREVGCVTVDGLGMLLHQAVPGFERWFGHRPSVDDALRSAVLA